MILVDSSVWIDAFGNRQTPQVARLKLLLGRVVLGIPDLVITEVLQGINGDREFEETRQILSSFEVIAVGNSLIAVEAARNYRRLRGLGITVRKTIDTLIATRCIVDGHELLFSDRDFDPFVTHLGLQSAMAEA